MCFRFNLIIEYASQSFGLLRVYGDDLMKTRIFSTQLGFSWGTTKFNMTQNLFMPTVDINGVRTGRSLFLCVYEFEFKLPT